MCLLVALSQAEISSVALSQVVPLSVDLTMVPLSPTATNIPGDVSAVKDVIAKVLLTFPAESITDIVQSE